MPILSVSVPILVYVLPKRAPGFFFFNFWLHIHLIPSLGLNNINVLLIWIGKNRVPGERDKNITFRGGNLFGTHFLMFHKGNKIAPTEDIYTGKDWRQKKKGMAEDQIVREYHQFNGNESEQTPGKNEGQGSWCATVHGVSKNQTWFSTWTTATTVEDKLIK